MSPPKTLHLTTLCALGALLAACVPAAAVEFPFGSAVGGTDYDLSPIPEALNAALCFVDTNGGGTRDGSEPVLLLYKTTVAGKCDTGLSLSDATQLSTSTGAMLLTTTGATLAGTEVRRSDELGGAPLTNLTGLHFIRFYEEGSNMGAMDAKDSVYVDLTGLSAPFSVSPGDLRLTTVGPNKGGTIVAANDIDEGRPLREMTRGQTGFGTSANNPLYKAASGYYLNADGDTVGKASFRSSDSGCSPESLNGTFTCSFAIKDLGVESGDVRLNAKAANPFSDAPLVLVERLEIVQGTVAPGAPFQVKVVAKNTGKAAGAGLVETYVGEQLVDGRGTPSIEPNGVAQVVMTLVAPDEPGRYTVRSGTYGDFLEVRGTTAPSATTSSDASDASPVSQRAPGPTALLALGGLVAAGLLARRSAL